MSKVSETAPSWSSGMKAWAYREVVVLDVFAKARWSSGGAACVVVSAVWSLERSTQSRLLWASRAACRHSRHSGTWGRPSRVASRETISQRG